LGRRADARAALLTSCFAAVTSQPFTSLSSLPDFDPRRIPVLGVDAHLPMVGNAELQPAALVRRFAMPPAWSPEIVHEKNFIDRAAVHASVLVPLVMRESLTVLLTQRTAHLSNHSGQIAFPGGRADDTDEDAAATALREAQEEVGLPPGHVRVIGNLPTYVTGSAFIITPVVGLVRPGFELQPNAHEVEDVFEVPLSFLMDPAHHRRHVFERDGVVRHWFSMPYVDGRGERFIWGATAGMIRNLYRFLSA
jgi:8-oxo-dGTP pyrophosphatase MutT (NUDIX family)